MSREFVCRRPPVLVMKLDFHVAGPNSAAAGKIIEMSNSRRWHVLGAIDGKTSRPPTAHMADISVRPEDHSIASAAIHLVSAVQKDR
jgi:hypothetical protein